MSKVIKSSAFSGRTGSAGTSSANVNCTSRKCGKLQNNFKNRNGPVPTRHLPGRSGRTPSASRGDIWMADVKFTGAIGHKVRPVIVKKRVGNQLVVYEVTSQGCRFATDVQIRDPHSLGLSKASAVKGSRTITIDISDLRQLLHRMSPSECEAIFSRMWYS